MKPVGEPAVLTNAGDAILVIEATLGGAWTLTALGPGATTRLGLGREAIGQPVSALPLPAALRPALTEALHQCLTLGQPVAATGGPEAADGNHWGVMVTPLLDGGPGPARLLCRLEPPAAPPPGFFQTVIDAVPVPIFIKGSDGRYLFCNRAFGELLGRTGRDFIGHTVFEVAPPHLAAMYHQADLALAAAGGRQVYEADIQRPDGDNARVVFYKSVFTNPGDGLDGIIGAILDITPRKAAEQALTDHMERLSRSELRLATMLAEQELIFEHATTGIVFAKNRHIQRANRRFCETFGVAPEAVVGLSLRTFHASDADFDTLGERAYPVMAAGGCYEEEIRLRHRDGRTIWCFLKGRAIDTGAPDLGTIWVVEDITERRRMMQALHAATLAATEANRMKSQFLVTMSHELRTPLNAVLGFSEVIKEQICGPINNERCIEYAADIHTCGEHLLSLINDILDLAKIEAGRMTLDARELDLGMLLAGAIRLVQGRAHSCGVTVRRDLGAPVPALVGDERAIRQILFNLLTNAIKFTPAGGSVTLSALRNFAGDVVLCVNDTGVGIPEDQIERVMRPFEQLDNRYARSEGGTGVGMALVKALTELHGGRVVIESAVGVGTCVSIVLPPPSRSPPGSGLP